MNELMRSHGVYGDGMNPTSINEVCREMAKRGWDVDPRNIVFGMGGGLLQKLDRDTCRFAIKCSWANVSGSGRDVIKRPKTDATKASKCGRLGLARSGSSIITVPEHQNELLRPVFEDGEILLETSMDRVRDLIGTFTGVV